MKRYGFLAGCIILACGITWSNITTAKCPPPKECKDPYVIAKIATAQEPACIEVFDCADKGCDACVIRIIWRADITRGEDLQCDEHTFPDGSKLVADITYHMRRNGPCGTPVGRHKGKFQIRSGTKLIGSGSMMGTNGLETHPATGNRECCAWPHDEGCMDGFIKIKDPQTGKEVRCELTATYASELDPTGTNPNDPCDPKNWRLWRLRIDGVALCKWEPPRTTTTTTTTTSRTITITIPTTFPTIVQ